MKVAPEMYEFFVEGGDTERSHALLHITEPSTPEEEAKGHFFAVAEIENGAEEHIEHLQRMIDDLEAGYYETEGEGNKDPFETALEAINRRGHHILHGDDVRIHCLVGVLRGNDVTIAYHGRPHALLFYQAKETLECTSIIEEEGGSDTQLFSALLEGTISAGDSLFVATPNVLDYVSPDRLQKIIASRQTDQAAAHLQKTLEDVSSELSFAGVLLHFKKKTFDTLTTPAESVNKLRAAEREADAMLSLPLLGETKKKLHSLMERRPKEDAGEPVPTETEEETNLRPRQDGGKSNESVAGTVLIAVGRAIVVSLVGVAQFLRVIGISIVHMFGGIWVLLTNSGNRRHDQIQRWKRAIQMKKQSYRSLPILSKILLVATILFGIAFLGSLSYIKLREQREQAALAYNNLVNSVRDRKEAAEGSLIYGNETKAFSLLTEAKDLLEQLPTNTEARQETKAMLQKEVDESLQRMRKMSVVTPDLLVDLTATRAEAKAERIAMIDDTILAFGENDSVLYRFDTVTKKIEQTTHDSIPHLVAATTPKEQDTTVFATLDGTLSRYQKENGALGTLEAAYANASPAIKDLFVYNQRLYTLDAANKAIYKHNKTQTGYDKGVVWNKNGAEDLAGAISIAIDGDVFVLTDKSLLKFAGGNKEDFGITGLDPALDKPTTLWTYNDVNNIYILEPTNKRVIVINKLGKLIAQYTAIEWQHPTDMIVDEVKKIVYVIDTNKIYQINL